MCLHVNIFTLVTKSPSSLATHKLINLFNLFCFCFCFPFCFVWRANQVTICHCKVNQTYRKFSTRSTSFIPILGFSRRPKMQGKLNKHWLSGKGLNAPQRAGDAAATSAATAAAGGSNAALQTTRHLPSKPSSGSGNSTQTQTTLGGQLHERPFQRHLAMNLENDMYYTVDFSENSQHSPLIQ